MSTTNKKKFIIAFDTICTGIDCIRDENNDPVLYDTEKEALKELTDDFELYGPDCFIAEASEIGHKTIYYPDKG